MPQWGLGEPPTAIAAAIVNELFSRVMPSAAPPRPPQRLKKWRRFVARQWQGTALDELAVGRLAVSAPWRFEAALPVLERYLKALRESQLPESSELLRAALKTPAGGWTQEFLGEVDQLAGQRPRLEEVQHVGHALEAYPAWPARRAPFWERRAYVEAAVRAALMARHPSQPDPPEPPWLIRVAFMWRWGDWRVDPDQPKTIKGLQADCSKWQRER